MSKKNIECEYCHTLISEDDIKCPHCGANCSNVIKKYRAEQKKEEEENKKEALDVFNNVATKNGRVVSIIAAIMFIAIFSFAIFQFSSFRSRTNINNRINNNGSTNKIETPINNEPKKEEPVVVGFNETAKTDEMSVILDSYELYEYTSKSFESYNTPKGYQKIAFHFTIENLDESELSTYSLISLTADDSNVDKSDLELHVGFEKVSKGKEKYESILNTYIGTGKILKGYVGYLVPKDKEILKFYIGKNITIEMKNPVYK